jgi:hypothetical protein
MLPGNEIQRKWKNIRDNFRKEVPLQKKVASGQEARERHKYIYCSQLLFLLPTMQKRGTLGNATREAQDVTTAHPVEQGFTSKGSYLQETEEAIQNNI